MCHPISASRLRFIEFETVPEAGDATRSLVVHHGESTIQVFPPRSQQSFHSAFELWNVPLFPIANRLKGEIHDSTIRAEISGIPISAPKNHGKLHLHGLAYQATPIEVQDSTTEDGRIREAIFRDFFGPYWTGVAELKVRQTLTPQTFHYTLLAKNIGEKPFPVGFGSHPYFRAPSGKADAIELLIPGDAVAEIDSLTSVLPTGRLIPVTDQRKLDFRTHRKLGGQRLDYFWTDLQRGEDGFPFVEMRDAIAGVGYRLTATTKNIIGIQVYYPGSGDTVAIEMISHLPDPRREVWGERPTGMLVLGPGETSEYGYRIEVFALPFRET